MSSAAVTNGFSSKLQSDSFSNNAKMEVRLNISAALVLIVLVGWAQAQVGGKFTYLTEQYASNFASTNPLIQECIPLSDCPSLLALWRNRHRIPGRNVYQVSYV